MTKNSVGAAKKHCGFMPHTKKTGQAKPKKQTTLPEYGVWVFPASAEEAVTFVPPPLHQFLSTVPLPSWAKHVAEAKLAYDKYHSQLQA
jgi:hypothetical protein